MTDEQHDPANAFREHQSRINSERELAAHQFTLAEVQTLRGEATTDPEAAKRYAALKPFIAKSNKRGDYREPHQMPPKEFAEYAGVAGKPVYSHADIASILDAVGGGRAETADSPLCEAWTTEFKRAQKEHRIMTGPQGARDQWVFDETDQARAQRLESYTAVMHLAVDARTRIGETLAQLDELASKQTEPDVIKTYVINQAAALAPHIRQTAGLAFDARDSTEFRLFDMKVSEAGGFQKWDAAATAS